MPHDSPSSAITVPRPKFDPAAPVPDRALHDVLATGAGGAPTTRLLAGMLGGAVGAVAILALARDWWTLATPLICVAATAGWGLATKRLLILGLGRRRAPVLRLALRAMQVATAALGVGAALAGAAGVVRLLLRP